MSGGMQIVLGSSGLGVLLVFLGVPWCSLGVHFGEPNVACMEAW
jgi:hypothetical protein